MPMGECTSFFLPLVSFMAWRTLSDQEADPFRADKLANGKTSTWYQGVKPTPSAQSPAKSSKCAKVTSVAGYAYRSSLLLFLPSCTYLRAIFQLRRRLPSPRSQRGTSRLDMPKLARVPPFWLPCTEGLVLLSCFMSPVWHLAITCSLGVGDRGEEFPPRAKAFCVACVGRLRIPRRSLLFFVMS